MASLLLLLSSVALASDGEPGEERPEEAAAAVGEAAAAVEAPGPLYCDADSEACEWPRPLPDRARFVVVTLHGEVSLGMAAYIDRVASRLEPGDILVLDINTFGGRVDAAVRIRDGLLRATEDEQIFTIAFIRPRAISAGALISFATDIIVVAPGATMGAATPVQVGQGGEAQPVEEKIVSYMRTEMRSTAEARGRSGDIAEAMVDKDLVVPGLSAEGKLLTLDGNEALAWAIASFQAQNIDQVIDRLGYGPDGRPYELKETEWSWAEKLAGWLSGSALTGILMTVGMLAIMIGLYTGGAPLPLAIGAVCLGIFFFGHHVVALAGFEEILIFILGLTLLAVEMLLPGYIIPGVLGVILVVVAMTMGLIDFESVPLSVQWELGSIGRALATVFGSIFATGVLAYVTFRYLPESEWGKRLFLDFQLRGRVTDKSEEEYKGLVGASGEAVTDLRPSGKVRIGDKRYEAVADRGHVSAGAKVEVVKSRGFALVVKRSAAPAAPEAPEAPEPAEPAEPATRTEESSS
jgi:membrane-bound serine protease (ClpP class)